MSEIISSENIQNRIFTFRGMQVMIDRDLAEMYEVATKVLNQAVKRNIERFPEEFMLQLTDEEKNELVTNCDRFKTLKHSSSNPYAFTEQGVAMLSSVLTSKIAVKVSIQIMNAFVEMRKLMSLGTIQKLRLSNIENKLLEHEQKFEQLFNALAKNEIPQKGIFYDGQVFDAWMFVADIIKSAKKSIILIDNYVDDTVLTLFRKKKKSVSVTILTKNISKQLQLDSKKFNEQYPSLEIKEFLDSHDRFLIIDEKILYHIGASLKDLGKKWFAFSKMDANILEIFKKAGLR